MTVEDIRQALRCRPVEPFRIRNGDVYELPIGGLMALASANDSTVVYVEDSPRFIDPREAVAMEPLEK